MLDTTNTEITTASSTDLDRAQEQGIAPWRDPVSQDQHVAVFLDRYPVTPGHKLFVPKHNIPLTIWQAFRQATSYGDDLVRAGQADGYNVGYNCGAAAGQTVMYPHVHLIPRRQGDCRDPIGGVRAVITGQANYRSSSYQKP